MNIELPVTTINTTERFLKKTLTRTIHSTLYEISVAQHLRLLIWDNTVCPCPKIRMMMTFVLGYLKLNDLLVGKSNLKSYKVCVISQFGRILILIYFCGNEIISNIQYKFNTHNKYNSTLFMVSVQQAFAVHTTFFSSILQAPVTHSRFWPLLS